MTEEKSGTKSDTITIKKDALWKYSTFVLAGILVILVIFFVLPGKSTTGAVIGNTPPPTVPTQPSQVTATADDDAFLGDENAPVTIIAFEDVQCPFCARFHRDTLPLIKQQYIDTGKVKYVQRDFPLTSIHPGALPGAIAGECIREQGGDRTYFEYIDILFGNQQSLTDSNFKQWAQDLGYNIDSCLDSNKYQSEVQKDLADAQAAGGRGTPYFVINGNPLSGAQPFSAFKAIIDAELSK